MDGNENGNCCHWWFYFIGASANDWLAFVLIKENSSAYLCEDHVSKLFSIPSTTPYSAVQHEVLSLISIIPFSQRCQVFEVSCRFVPYFRSMWKLSENTSLKAALTP